MYGAFCGWSNECYLGHGFALQFDIQAALFLDVIRERQQYTTGVRYGIPQPTAESKRTLTQWTAVPEVNGSLNLVWYPIQSVQLRLGYDVMAFFNTVSSPRPIDFNYGSLTAPYQSTSRLFDGLIGSLDDEITAIINEVNRVHALRPDNPSGAPAARSSRSNFGPGAASSRPVSIW